MELAISIWFVCVEWEYYFITICFTILNSFLKNIKFEANCSVLLVVNNLDKFNNSSEINASVFTAFANYSKTIFFGRNKHTIFNLATRDDVFNHLTQTYFDLLNNVEVVIQQRRDLPFAYQEPKISFEEVRDEFIYINDCSYGLIDYRQKPINVMAKDYTIQVFEPNKGNYLRKKIGYDDVYDMKGSIFGERLKEVLEEAVAAHEGGEDD